jgi:23S rRNA pseudouridine1911/1915/1917 synthase
VTGDVRLLHAHVVPEGQRDFLDRYASRAVPLLPSRNAAHKAADRGELRVDGIAVGPHHVVKPGQRVELWSSTRTVPPPLAVPVPVVFEDDDLAVVEKPPGLPTSGRGPRTVERALRANLAPSAAEDALPWPRPVHRLDGPTGGLLLVAKSRRAQIGLGRALEERRVRKRYRALVIGRLEGDGTVDSPIDGREAATIYRPVRHTHAVRGEWLTTVDAWPLTGRTHQIRRHLASLGHPVLGDAAHGLPGLVLSGQGLFLHAVELMLDHPVSGEPLWVATREPPKFESWRAREERRFHRLAHAAAAPLA